VSVDSLATATGPNDRFHIDAEVRTPNRNPTLLLNPTQTVNRSST
jgi:hypothetical protein